MRRFKLINLLIVLLVLACVKNAETIELTKDNPKTLISTNSRNYTICGLRLGLTYEEAWKILSKSKILVGKKDTFSNGIYVSLRKTDYQGDSCLFLGSEVGGKKIEVITIFQDFRSLLAPNFRRLMTFESIDNNSIFKRNFIGYENRSKDFLIDDRGKKITHHFYDDIGLAVIHNQDQNGKNDIRLKLYLNEIN